MIMTGFYPTCWGQDSIVLHMHMQEVQIEDRQHRDLGEIHRFTLANLDSLKAIMPLNLAEWLDNQNVFLRRSIPGGLATSSVRGANASQTLVLWNGIPLNSPMLGLTDIALLPWDVSTVLEWSPSAQGTTWGSGAIGGVLSMGFAPKLKNHLHVFTHTGMGSFGLLRHNVHVDLGNEKWQYSLRLNTQVMNNDYSYTIDNKATFRQQTNAALKQHNIMQDIHVSLKTHLSLSASMWWQNAHRQIPPTSQQNQSTAWQDDENIRSMIQIDYKKNNHILESKVGYVVEYNRYVDPPIKLDATHQYQTKIADILYTYKSPKNRAYHIGITSMSSTASSPGYANGNHNEKRFAAFGSYMIKYKKVNFNLRFRQDWLDGQPLASLPQLSMQYAIGGSCDIGFKFNRNFRMPTLNDRYWHPGGNVSLLPESGWSQELNLYFKKQYGQWEARYEATAFNRRIHNWILWSLKEGQNFWSAQNIGTVWSRGVDMKAHLGYTIKNKQLLISSSFQYVLSSHLQDVSFPRIVYGAQLVYTPQSQGFISIQYPLYKCQILYRHDYTGVSQGFTKSIDAYSLGSLRAQYFKNIASWACRIYTQIDNIWNVSYEIFEFRPMPNRSYALGLAISFKK